MTFRAHLKNARKATRLRLRFGLQVYKFIQYSQVYGICKQQENNVHTKHVQHLQYCGTETFIKILTLTVGENSGPA